MVPGYLGLRLTYTTSKGKRKPGSDSALEQAQGVGMKLSGRERPAGKPQGVRMRVSATCKK